MSLYVAYNFLLSFDGNDDLASKQEIVLMSIIHTCYFIELYKDILSDPEEMTRVIQVDSVL